jgi:hypothetical protein
MSDVFTKRRPMIDLDEFERRLCADHAPPIKRTVTRSPN